VEWVYLDELSEFIFAQPLLQARIDQLGEKEDEDSEFNLREEIEKIWHRKTNVVFNITTGGMACGPVWSTVRFGLNFVPDQATPSE
jgi:hypothetical protein